MLDIFNPIHNIKEICKEFLLLEDHLQAPEKRCNDCIRKHLLKAEAFAEEAIALDKTGKYLEMCQPLPIEIRKLQDAYVNGIEDHALGQKVRILRKKLSPHCFAVNTKRTTKLKKKAPLAKSIADGLWSTKKHLAGYKYLVLALQKAQNKEGPAFLFKVPGVSAKIRHSQDWISTQSIKTLQKGQVGRMVNQSTYSKIDYSLQEWIQAVRSDLLGATQINLKTPSSSVGEIISDERIRKRAITKAIEMGQKEILKRALKFQNQARLENDREKMERSAKMFFYLGKKTREVYFLVKAAVLFEKIDDPRESLAFKEVLAIEPHHPLRFWLGNKVQLASKIKSIPKGTKNTEDSTEEQENLVLLGLLAFGAGVGLGFV
jgi:hypothetical protein